MAPPAAVIRVVHTYCLDGLNGFVFDVSTTALCSCTMAAVDRGSPAYRVHVRPRVFCSLCHSVGSRPAGRQAAAQTTTSISHPPPPAAHNGRENTTPIAFKSILGSPLTIPLQTITFYHRIMPPCTANHCYAPACMPFTV